MTYMQAAIKDNHIACMSVNLTSFKYSKKQHETSVATELTP